MAVKYPPKIESESDLQQYIARGMEQNGWTALREVDTSFDDYTADIIGHRDDIGTIGIECKYVTGGPVVAAKAARQIVDKYAGQKFVKWHVDMWAVCLYGRAFRPREQRQTDSEWRNGFDKGTVSATQRILNGFGIGFTTVQQSRVFLEFLPSGGDVRIPLFQADGDMPAKYSEKFDRERALELIERRPTGD